jgi:hypothetical protein
MPPIWDPVIDGWAKAGQALAVLAFVNVVVTAGTRSHGVTWQLVSTGAAFLSLCVSVVGLVRTIRRGLKTVTGVLPVLMSLAALAGALIFFVVH